MLYSKHHLFLTRIFIFTHFSFPTSNLHGQEISQNSQSLPGAHRYTSERDAQCWFVAIFLSTERGTAIKIASTDRSNSDFEEIICSLREQNKASRQVGI